MSTKLVLLRHGQSDWNLKNLFTGWTDVDLTEQGITEAIDAGRLLGELDQLEVCHCPILPTPDDHVEGFDFIKR